MIQEQLNPCNVLIGLSLYLTIALFVWQDVVLAQIEHTPQEEVIEMDTDHTPMLSAPKELHQILMQLAKKYAHGGV